MLKRKYQIFFLSFVLFGLSACTSRFPTDLTLKDLTLVEIQSLTGNEIDNGRYKSTEETFYRLKLNFSSYVNLWDYAKETDYVISVESSFCNMSSLKAFFGSGRVFWKDFDLQEDYSSLGSVIKANSKGEFFYTTYIGLYGPKITSHKKNADGSKAIEFNEYDLVKKTESLCVQVVGSSYVGGSRSNTIVIGEKLIAEKLRNLGSD